MSTICSFKLVNQIISKNLLIIIKSEIITEKRPKGKWKYQNWWGGRRRQEKGMLLNQHTTYTHMHTQQQQQHAKSKTTIYGAIKLETTLQAIYLTYSFIHQQQQQQTRLLKYLQQYYQAEISAFLSLNSLSTLRLLCHTHTHLVINTLKRITHTNQ